MSIAAIIVAGGSGQRAGGGQPKQLRTLLGRPVAAWSVETLARHNGISQTILVVPETHSAGFETLGADRIVTGGETRTRSVLAGLAALSGSDVSHVLIHDAARPGLTAGVIDALIAALAEADAAAPALPLVDALKRRSDGRLATVPREGLYRVQTPQAFRRELIERALDAARADLVDDIEAVEALGASVVLVPGAARLAKITYPEDFAYVTQLLSPATPPRIGKGFDVHAFGPGNQVRLCGIAIPHDKALAGHSDADVGWHALTDAILGALALGDIGDHFPPSDPKWKGADSALFLSEACRLAAAQGYCLTSCDITLICEAPKIKPHREAMRARTAEITGLAQDHVSVKATTTEGLGFAGRGEGIAAEAVAVIAPRA
ncbi:MAG: bifunctional 2-C-methyl-D-erythritol 4-phosphate cytidylyltransferase/2-C-methyl-D-erythritol 2,4-cyclodiphosphate synthase [Alphaproteobacteria bacterium]|jgi:2-C-methyl-D-erythritol 4-phosphate cytidylyltransferase/2-C-methyl-D-erythritol 2,4-cyclodiphosphate synthase|nr:bifunctional 2-C-methyl-D-erythritol 4-phosphate cytidylyltransferase/2-C-methyl-D-erythritol 2,4-cyclodiphosphate synthase [Alphaproteobacteria bacterium]